MRLDHVVWIVRDLDAAAAAVGDLGFEVVPGGRHAGLGSRNALVALADGSYLELASFADPPDPPLPAIDPGTPRADAQARLEAGGARRFEARWLSQAGLASGLSDLAFALRDGDGSDGRGSDGEDGNGGDGKSGDGKSEGSAGASRDRAWADVRARGVDLSEPLAMRRTRPDGYELSWRMVHPDGSDLPFLIDDLTPRGERVPAAGVHPNGAAGIAGVAVAVRDLARSVARWRDLLGHEPAAATDADGRPGRAFEVGPSRVVLVSAVEHPDLADRIAVRGEGVYQVVLERAAVPAAGDPRSRPAPSPATGPSERSGPARDADLDAALAAARRAARAVLGDADLRWGVAR